MAKPVVSSASEMLKTYTDNPVRHVWAFLPSTFDPQYGHNFPIFNVTLIPTMLKDSRVRFGLNLIKGPIQSFTIFLPEDKANQPAIHETIREQGVQFPYIVKCENQEVRDFLLKTLNRFWENGLRHALSAIEWGFSCSQVIYRKGINNRIEYDSLKLYNALSVRPLLKQNALVGANVRGVEALRNGLNLVIPKVFWHTHARETNSIFGQSRLEWCFVPWHETWVCYGARDIRRTWFHRNSFDGGQMYYPIGKTKLSDGSEVSNDVLAAQMMSNIRTGGYRIFPDETNPESGKQRWQYEPPAANITPQGLMEYPEQLRLEILEGLGIPPEVIESQSDGGFGSATGRKVPMVAYYSSLSILVSDVITDFRKFILDYLVLANWRKPIEYEIERLVPTESESPSGVPGGAGGKADTITSTVKDTGLSV